MRDPVEIAADECGGQALRTSLALSLVTGTPARLRSLRAGQPARGLQRRHLAAVRAAASIGGASVRGDRIGSTELEFHPAGVRAGDHEFRLGAAGNTARLLQTVLWPLLLTDSPSVVTVHGGTHTPLAPTFEFLERSLLPRLRQMGVDADLTLVRHGFSPAGGGCLRAHLRPSTLRPHSWLERGRTRSVEARALVSRLPLAIAERELETAIAALGWPPGSAEALLVEAASPGNALLLGVTSDSGCTVASAIGVRHKSAEAVAREAVEALERHLSLDVPIDGHLAGQLLVPMALAHGGSLMTGPPSLELRVHAEVISRFLPVRTSFEDRGEGRWLVSMDEV